MADVICDCAPSLSGNLIRMAESLVVLTELLCMFKALVALNCRIILATVRRVHQTLFMSKLLLMDIAASAIIYNDEGGRFPREDYGQQSSHGPIPEGVPHEHQWLFSPEGLPIGEQTRQLSPTGIPISPWF